MRIALIGNPNSGKTTMFNALTGRNEKIGNWSGVTIDSKISKLKKEYYSGKEDIELVDLPGTYSLSAYTNEEKITNDFVIDEQLDVIVNIVDLKNLNRSLFLTTELLELNIPIVVALNKSDLKDVAIDVNKLKQLLNCNVVKTSAIDRGDDGLRKLIQSAIEAKGIKQLAPFKINGLLSKEENDKDRYSFIENVCKQVEIRNDEKTFKLTSKIDDIITNPILGILFFVLVMWLVFDISQASLGPFLADTLVGWIEAFQENVRTMIKGASPFVEALLVDGIIGGVGAVVGFLPLVMVMYFLISLLEDSGYMARVSVVLDPFFKKVGLSGKSIIPMVIGTGCSIPGVMACRTIKNERERKATAMLTPFMPCGAKLPVIALFAGVFFNNSSWVGTLMYFVGIALVFVGALLVNKIAGGKYHTSYFMIELPDYKIPSIKLAISSMFQRAKDYIVKAGTIILVCNAVVQIMQAFTWNLTLVEEGMESTSILASIATPFAFLLIPLGFGTWQLASAAITGFIAKENVVGTLAVVYGMTNFIDVDNFVLVGGASEVATIMGLTKAAALAYLMFNLFTPPCFAAIGAMNSELKDKKWLMGGIALQFSVGYVLAFFVYQIGTLIATSNIGVGFFPGLFVVVLIVLYIVYLINKTNRELEKMCN